MTITGSMDVDVDDLTIPLHWRRATTILGVWIASLFAAHLIAGLVHHFSNADSAGGLVDAFDMNLENSVTTWSAALILATAAGLCGLTAWASRRANDDSWRKWMFIAGIITVLSIEEVADLHGYWGTRLQDQLETTGPLRYAWIMPAAVLVVIVAGTLARFVFGLDRPLRIAILTGGAMYVGAAIGLEVIHGVVTGSDSFGLWLLHGVEETLELVAVSIVIVALLRDLERRFGNLALRFDEPASAR